METIKASDAKRSFGDLLVRIAREPVAIKRHGKVVAVVSSPEHYQKPTPDQARQSARQAQRAVDAERLMRHYQVAVALLAAPAKQCRALLQDALAVVDRWERDRLCSRDYIERWRQWLALPVDQLVAIMTSEADGWGNAMRQNSPFTTIDLP